MKHLSFTLLIALLIVACQRELDFSNVGSTVPPETEKNEYAISEDSALAYLEDFMKNEPITRSSDNRIVGSIAPVKYNRIRTKVAYNDLDCENLLYIVNFEGEQGYAILAADARIKEPILAIVDEGTLSVNAVYDTTDHFERPIYDGYPLEGDGFFTTPETGDEIFINPNTVSFYIDDMDDTLVGNFDEYSDNSPSANSSELFTSHLCVSYALNEINTYEQFHHNPDDDSESEPDDEDHPDDGPEPGGDHPSLWTEVLKSPWSVSQFVSPILTDFIYWHQDYPFNDLYPSRRYWIIVGRKRKAPAGCFPLALAKLLTYYESPNRYSFQGYTINWKELKKSFTSTIGSNSAAYLLKSISSACDSWYFYQGTFTFPGLVTKYMRFIGYNNAQCQSYSFDLVKRMLDNGAPLIIYSVPGIDITSSHSWNIDGYKVKEQTVTINSYYGETLIRSTTRTDRTEMVHCDFGWKGICNGYYVSGIFKLNSPDIEYDPGSNYSDNTNYNHLLNVITYDKP